MVVILLDLRRAGSVVVTPGDGRMSEPNEILEAAELWSTDKNIADSG